MGRRSALQGVCNDLLDSFISRNNDLNGYWALGKFQAFLTKRSREKLCFLLVGENSQKSVFPQTLTYYQFALDRHLRQHGIQAAWVNHAIICVNGKSATDLTCSMVVTTDVGRIFGSQRDVFVRPHDPFLELRSGGHGGPKNQKGE